MYGTFARCAPIVLDDGSILVGQADFSILKLKSNGTPDVSFGNLGVLPNPTSTPLLLQDFVRLQDGRLLLAGLLDTGSRPPNARPVPYYQPVLVRYLPSGAPDTTFGDNGLAQVPAEIFAADNGQVPADALNLLSLPNGAGVLAVSEASSASAYIYRFQGDVPLSLAPNYQGLWWNSPAGSEAGWGINFAHQGDQIFASWFYLRRGRQTMVVGNDRREDIRKNIYGANLYQVQGPALDTVPFPPIGQNGGATGAVVGQATLTFADDNNATFAYTVNGTAQTKAITKQAFGLLPICAASANPTLATNYQDLWWAAPAGSEAGWGINLTHQGDTIFGTWFTYAHDRAPTWLVVTAARTAQATYSGALYRPTSGPPFNASPFPEIGSAGGAIGGIVGSAMFTFSDGNSGIFSYDVDGVHQSKTITREVFASWGTSCR